jgi:D-alanine-D-alanine ligase
MRPARRTDDVGRIRLADDHRLYPARHRRTGALYGQLGGGKEFIRNVLNEKVDIVFNIAEGRGTYRSREAQVPSILEMLDIPYVGSDPECLAVCLDKHLTKKLLKMEGIPTPEWRLIANQQELKETVWKGFPFPAIIKPSFEGSSKGIHANSLVDSAAQAAATVSEMLELTGSRYWWNNSSTATKLQSACWAIPR